MPPGNADSADRSPALSERLATLRARHALTRSRLAALLHVSAATLRRWEAGDGRPRAARLALLERLERDGPAALSEPPVPSLPAPIDSFIGRTADLETLAQMLRGSRLLTLTGPGGAGKTRLALELAQRVKDRYAHGVVLVELAGLADPALVESAVTAALGVREQAGVSSRALLIRRLRDQRTLLLIDNCEHLLAAVADLAAALLHGCPGLQLLATSRESLGIAGEAVWPVAPLALPPDEGALGAVAASEAVQLFVHRAQERAPAFALSEANAAAVATVCRRLDGLPLALELAAGWARLLSPAQIAASLDERAALPRSGGRDVPARHLTLDAAMAWSYALLDPAERRAFARLAVFSGGFTIEAMAAVCAEQGDAADATLALLDRLVNKSLVAVAYDTPRPRLLLLETVRAYALTRLQAEGDEDDARDRHARYHLDFVLHRAPLLDGARQGETLAQLEQEHDNIRAALARLDARGDGAQYARFATALAAFYELHSHLSEGRATLERALRLCGDDLSARVGVLFALGRLAYRQNDIAAARAWGEEALPLALALDDTPAIMRLHNLLGLALLAAHDYAAAREHTEAALAIARAAGYLLSQPPVLGNLALLASDQRQFAVARAHFDEAIAIASEQGALYSLAIVLHSSAHMARRAGDLDEALTRHLAALGLFSELGSRQGIAECLTGLALVAACRQHTAHAVRLLAASATQFEAAGGGLSPSYQPDQAAAVRQLRAALGEAAFAHEWTLGAGLALEAALATAWATPSTRPEPARTAPREPLPRVGPAISARESDVLRLLASGATNKEIAQALGLSVRTVESHLLNVYAKIGARGRADATAYALRHALVTL